MGGFRRKPSPPPPPPAPKPVTATSSTGAERPDAEEVMADIETGGETQAMKRRGKRKLRNPVTQTAGTNVGGEGTSGLQIPKG